MKAFISALVLILPFIATPPAQASTNLGTFGFDCTVNPSNLVISASAGDTFTVDFPNCKVSGYNGQYFVYASDFPFPANAWVAPKMITMALDAPIALRVYDPANQAVIYNIEFRLVSSGGGGGGGGGSAPSTEPAPAHPIVGQGLPMPASGNCADVDDKDFSWGTGLYGGWHRSWTTWRRDNGEIFHDGWACIRSFEHVDGSWRIRNHQ